MSGAARAWINTENVPIVRQQVVQAEPEVESTGQPTTPSIPDNLVDDGSSDESTNIHRTYHSQQVKLNEEWASIRSTITKQMIWSALWNALFVKLRIAMSTVISVVATFVPYAPIYCIMGLIFSTSPWYGRYEVISCSK